jgi:hypothetical protein
MTTLALFGASEQMVRKVREWQFAAIDEVICSDFDADEMPFALLNGMEKEVLPPVMSPRHSCSTNQHLSRGQAAHRIVSSASLGAGVYSDRTPFVYRPCPLEGSCRILLDWKLYVAASGSLSGSRAPSCQVNPRGFSSRGLLQLRACGAD